MPILPDCVYPSHPKSKPTVLIVASGTDNAVPLRAVPGSDKWLIEKALTCREAILAARRFRPRVVLCEERLPDGTWRDLLRELDELWHGSRLIVVSPNADDALWAEVLNLGGYDVLTEPVDRIELQRVIENCYPEWPPVLNPLSAVSATSTETEVYTF